LRWRLPIRQDQPISAFARLKQWALPGARVVVWGILYHGCFGAILATPGMHIGLEYPHWVLYYTGFVPCSIKELSITSLFQSTDKIPPFTDTGRLPANFAFQKFLLYISFDST